MGHPNNPLDVFLSPFATVITNGFTTRPLESALSVDLQDCCRSTLPFAWEHLFLCKTTLSDEIASLWCGFGANLNDLEMKTTNGRAHNKHQCFSSKRSLEDNLLLQSFCRDFDTIRLEFDSNRGRSDVFIAGCHDFGVSIFRLDINFSKVRPEASRGGLRDVVYLYPLSVLTVSWPHRIRPFTMPHRIRPFALVRWLPYVAYNSKPAASPLKPEGDGEAGGVFDLAGPCAVVDASPPMPYWVLAFSVPRAPRTTGISTCTCGLPVGHIAANCSSPAASSTSSTVCSPLVITVLRVSLACIRVGCVVSFEVPPRAPHQWGLREIRSSQPFVLCVHHNSALRVPPAACALRLLSALTPDTWRCWLQYYSSFGRVLSHPALRLVALRPVRLGDIVLALVIIEVVDTTIGSLSLTAASTRLLRLNSPTTTNTCSNLLSTIAPRRTSGRGTPLLQCGDVEPNPGPPKIGAELIVLENMAQRLHRCLRPVLYTCEAVSTSDVPMPEFRSNSTVLLTMLSTAPVMKRFIDSLEPLGSGTSARDDP